MSTKIIAPAEAAIDHASLLYSLSQLNTLIDEARFADYWQRGAEIVCEAFSAFAVSIYLLEPGSSSGEKIFRVGRLESFMLAQVEEWERSLDAAGMSAMPAPAMQQDLPVLCNSNDLLILAFPILVDGITRGGISLAFPKDNVRGLPSFGSLNYVLQSFAGHGLRARYLQATRKRLERINLLYQVSQSITSTLELTTVLNQTTQMAAGVLNAQAATLYRVDAASQEIIFWIPKGEAASMLEEMRMSSNQGIVGWVATHRHPMIVNDPANSELWDPAVDAQTGFTTRSIVAIPLLIKDELVGVLEVLNKDEPEGFTHDDLEWLLVLGQQVASALVNAHLYAREQEKVRELATLSKVSQTINSELDVSVTLNAVTRSVLDVLSADRSELLLLNERQKALKLFATFGYGTDRDIPTPNPPPVGQGLAGWCAQHNKPLAVRQADQDSRYIPWQGLPELDKSSIAMVPLTFRNAVTGVIIVYSLSGRPFDDEKLNVLQTFANQAAIALQNATLYQDLRAEQERIITTQEEVRHHLARDLHDNTAQMLSLITLNLGITRKLLTQQRYDDILEELNKLEAYARQTNREVRTLLFELRPIILESRGLIPALQSYHRQLPDSLDCTVYLEADPLPFEIRLQGASAIFSIIQEAVNNIRRHATAQHVWIRVSADQTQLYFEIEDDGKGFNIAEVQVDYDRRGSFGLLNMRERASLLGGRLTIESPRAEGTPGTIIRGRIPLAGLRKETRGDDTLNLLRPPADPW